MPTKLSKSDQSKPRNLLKNRKSIVFIAAVLAAPLFICLPAGRVLAVNDVQVTGNTNFELNTFDTAALTTIVASSGGQVTNFDVQSNYIDITLDNTSTVTFTTTVGGQYLKIIHQSGSNNYTVTPSCPTHTVTLTGTGVTVILRLEVLMTNSCGGGPVCGDGICNGSETCSSCSADCGSCGGGGIMPLNGVCGIAVNGSYYSIPATNYLCNYGTPSAVTGSGPWTWICSGLYGGSNSPTCTANKVSNFPAGCTSTSGHSTTTGLSCSGIVPTPAPTASNCAPAPSVCAPYMTKYIKLGAANDPNEVKKLQIFLRDYEGFSTLSVTGIYDQATFNAVKVFQLKYTQDVLVPWGFTTPTGYVYTTTEKKINEIYCQVTAAAVLPSVCAPAPSVCAPYMTKYIKLGAANDAAEVRKLQTFLINYEGFTNLTVTGVYDDATFDAVEQFQSKYAQDVLVPWGFTTPTGYVYTTTEKEINKIYCSKTPVTPNPIIVPTTPTPSVCGPYMTKYIKLGAANDPNEVKKLQIFLRDYEGFSTLTVTGVYDDATFDAVEQFQSKYAQDVLVPWGFTTPTGYVYTTTEKEINKIYCSKTPVIPTPITPTPIPVPTLQPVSAPTTSFTEPLSFGSNDPQVVLLQDTLKKLGFFPQSVASNGNFGPTTLKAVQDFQVHYNIAGPGAAGYGQVGPNTRRELNQLINQ